MKSLANHFLIAMPGLADENFNHSVTLICHHDDEGAMGIIINQPLRLTVQELFSENDLQTDKLRHPGQAVFFGGPVRPDHLFILHDNSQLWENTLLINNNLCLTTSTDFLTAMAAGETIDNHLVSLGYAGWGPGQLEHEMIENSWVYAVADNEIIFQTAAEKRWEEAAALAGIDLNKMTFYSGSA